MKILAINTATAINSLACAEDSEILGSIFLKNKTGQSESLILEIKKFLDSLNLKIKDIEIISVISGPGSYTGLRMGLTTAKTIAQLQKQKIVLIDTLENLAFQVKAASGLLAAVLKATQEFYNLALFSLKNNIFERLTEDIILKESQLVAKLAAIAGPFFLAGASRELYDKIKQMNSRTQIIYLSEDSASVNSAGAAALLGCQKARAGDFAPDILKIKPFYLHPVKIIKKEFRYSGK